jgi:deazaflavin-dependent oxidoreductase (nitroreductase family)
MTKIPTHDPATARGDAAPTAPAHYRKPDWFSHHVMGPVLNLLMHLGVSVWGSRILEHRGRTSGHLHHTPVNLLTVDGVEYLVAARGETQWVRNVRAADGRLALLLGRRRTECTAREVSVGERPAVLRAYLARWKFEVGMFFDGVGPDSADEEFERIAADHPVFALSD